MYAYRYTYQPNSTSKYNAYKSMGTASLDNSKSSGTATLKYTVQSSDTAKISVVISNSVSGEIDAVFAKIKASTSVSVSKSVSYTAGTSYSASLTIPAKKHGSITGYIPAIKTSGKIKIEHYDANSTDKYVISTTYKTVNTSYVPLTSDRHFVSKTW